MSSGLYKLGKHTAFKKLGMDFPDFAQWQQVMKQKDMARALERLRDPAAREGFGHIRDILSSAGAGAMDSSLNPSGLGRSLGAGMVPAAAGAGVGALAGGEDARLEGAMLGAGAGLAGGAMGHSLGGSLVGPARRAALSEGLSGAMTRGGRMIEQGLEGVPASQSMKTELPGAAKDLLGGASRSKGLDIIGKGSGTIAGGTLGAAGGGLAAKAHGKRKSEEKARAQESERQEPAQSEAPEIESQQLSDLGLLYGN